MKSLKLIIPALFLLLSTTLLAQDTLKTKNGVKQLIIKMLTTDQPVVVLPAFFVSPETSVGFGAATMFYFRTHDDSLAKPSNFQSIFIYTFQNQIIFKNPFDIFLHEDRYWLNGELSYYIYPYNYYGQGIHISIDHSEPYTARYMRAELNALRKTAKHLYIGPTVLFDHYFSLDVKKGGVLESNDVRGIKAGQLLGMGASFKLDRRNNLFAPHKGFYMEGRALFYQDQWVGNYAFKDIYLDARKYFFLDDQWETGFQFYHQTVLGDAPFFNLAQLGNSRIMRGYYSGAYRDHHYTAAQTEIRHYLLDRVLISAFGGVGTVSGDMMKFDKLLGSYGMGLRYELNKKEHIRIRLDYARGYHSSGFYININEAF